MNNKTNQELFKQALVEGINRRLDREIAACDEEIAYSRRHIKNMARIVRGKEIKKPLNRKMIAILVAAAILLLAGCAIIYRNEIREFVSKVYESFVDLRFDEGENYSQTIEETYELTYLPDGYTLEKSVTNRMGVEYLFVNADDNHIRFIQRPIDAASFSVDIENSDNEIIEIGNYTVYSRKTNGTYYYLWNDGKYALHIYSVQQLSDNELILIINGMNKK